MKPDKHKALYIISIICIIILTVILLCFVQQNSGEKASAFPHEYGVFLREDSSDISMFSDYHTVVIDAANFTDEDITRLKREGHEIYSYLNIGSIEDFRPYYNDYKSLTLSAYDNWEGEYWIDVSDSKWQNFITDTLVPSYINMGITNFFIDNCDVYYHYESDDIYAGISSILTSIKSQTSSANGETIINGGDTYVTRYLNENGSLDAVADGVNQETVFTAIDFSGNTLSTDNGTFSTDNGTFSTDNGTFSVDKGTFSVAKKADTNYYLSYLDKVSESGSDIYILEYCNDSSLSKEIKKKCKQLGYTVYISSSLNL